MRYQLKRTVALVGMMGAGKTAVGTAVAQMLAVPFRDSDAEIEKAANRTIPEIFARDGEAFFREKEALVLARLMGESRKGILSTGGGAYLRAENRALISTEGAALWLRAPVDLLWSRVRHREGRPLLQTGNPLETLRALAQARDPVYAQAEMVIDCERAASVEETAARVIARLLEDPAVLVRRKA